MKTYKITIIIISSLILFFICFTIIFLLSIYYKIKILTKHLKEDFNTDEHHNYNIDAVYTWVDSNDENWKIIKSKFTNSLDESIRYSPDINSDGELQLSIELLLQNATWINKIYIVTMNQVPTFLLKNKNLSQLYNKKIFIIDHKQIIDNNCLPTFNSHAIETSIQNIPNLSEHFIYLNDDVLITNKVEPYHFFNNGKPYFRYSILNSLFNWFVPVFIKNDAYFKPRYNLRKQLKYTCLLPKHSPLPLTKNLINLSKYKFTDKYNQTKCSKFRSQNDIPPISVAYYYGLENNLVIFEKTRLNSLESIVNNMLFYDNDKENITFKRNKMLNHNISFVCINNLDNSNINLILNEIRNFYLN